MMKNRESNFNLWAPKSPKKGRVRGHKDIQRLDLFKISTDHMKLIKEDDIEQPNCAHLMCLLLFYYQLLEHGHMKNHIMNRCLIVWKSIS